MVFIVGGGGLLFLSSRISVAFACRKICDALLSLDCRIVIVKIVGKFVPIAEIVVDLEGWIFKENSFVMRSGG